MGVVLSKTRRLNLRVDEELYEGIEATADRENIDKSMVVRRWLMVGLREARRRRGVEMYSGGVCSLWRAAMVAGVGLREMMDLVVEARVPLRVSSDDVETAWREAFEG